MHRKSNTKFLKLIVQIHETARELEKALEKVNSVSLAEEKVVYDVGRQILHLGVMLIEYTND